MNKFGFAFLGTTQGRVAAIAYLALLVTFIGSVLYENSRVKEKQNRIPAEELFLIIVLTLVAFALQVYSINCMVVGSSGGVGCGVWAWVNSAVACVVAVVALLAVLFRR